MADIDVVQKPAGNLAWLWALIAVLSVAGLMAWLAVQSDRTTTAALVQEQPGERRARGGPAAERVEIAALAANPDTYQGERIQVDAAVAAQLGPRAFWGDVRGANPFLIVATEGAGLAGVQAGNVYTVQGMVVTVTESAVDRWVAEGAVGEGARDEATFATHALLVDEVVR
jgi:hypothetical protein